MQAEAGTMWVPSRGNAGVDAALDVPAALVPLFADLCCHPE